MKSSIYKSFSGKIEKFISNQYECMDRRMPTDFSVSHEELIVNREEIAETEAIDNVREYMVQCLQTHECKQLCYLEILYMPAKHSHDVGVIWYHFVNGCTANCIIISIVDDIKTDLIKNKHILSPIKGCVCTNNSTRWSLIIQDKMKEFYIRSINSDVQQNKPAIGRYWLELKHSEIWLSDRLHTFRLVIIIHKERTTAPILKLIDRLMFNHNFRVMLCNSNIPPAIDQELKLPEIDQSYIKLTLTEETLDKCEQYILDKKSNPDILWISKTKPLNGYACFFLTRSQLTATQFHDNGECADKV